MLSAWYQASINLKTLLRHQIGGGEHEQSSEPSDIENCKVPASSSSSKSSSAGTSEVWLEISSRTDIEEDRFFASIGLCGFCGVLVGEFSFSSSAAGGT